MMKHIKLQRASFTNFKGIKQLTVPFNTDGTTTISGDNGTFKSSIFDGIMWLLWNKDSHGVADFGIKPRDKDGNEVHRVDTEVEADFLVQSNDMAGDMLVVLKKVQREVWTVPKGKV